MSASTNSKQIAGYNLLYLENSDTKCDSSVRFFRTLDAARSAMRADFEAQNRILNFPTGTETENEDCYRSVSEDGIFVRDGLDTFCWEVQPAIPEDKPEQYPIVLTIGDWSGNGHEKFDEYKYLSNKPIEDVREAHFRIKDATGIDIETVCAKAGCDTLEAPVIERLKELGYELDPYVEETGGVISVDDMAHIWVFLLQKADPELNLEPAFDTFSPIQFYGQDKKGRHIGSIGYGLYS